MANMKDIVTELNEAIASFIKDCLHITDWDDKPSSDKFSKKEIIGHLIDSAQINLQRFVRCTYEEGFKLIYDADQWVKVQHYQDIRTDELLSLWRLLNMQIIKVLGHYPADRLTAQCDTGIAEISLHTVSWLAQDYVDHLKHHLEQIQRGE